MTLPPDLEAAIEAGVADGSIFSDSHRLTDTVIHESSAVVLTPATLDAPSLPPIGAPFPVEFQMLSPALRRETKVMWRCSCGEMWAGTDMERDVHVHAAFEGGTHRVNGPIFRDDDTEADVRAAWAKEDSDD